MVGGRFLGQGCDDLRKVSLWRSGTSASGRGRVKTLATAVGTWRSVPIGRGEGREFGAVKRGRLGLCPHEGNQKLRSEDVQRPFQVVGQDLQAHFRSDPRQGLGQEVSRPHPRLERAKRMLDGLPTQP